MRGGHCHWLRVVVVCGVWAAASAGKSVRSQSSQSRGRERLGAMARGPGTGARAAQSRWERPWAQSPTLRLSCLCVHVIASACSVTWHVGIVSASVAICALSVSVPYTDTLDHCADCGVIASQWRKRGYRPCWRGRIGCVSSDVPLCSQSSLASTKMNMWFIGQMVQLGGCRCVASVSPLSVSLKCALSVGAPACVSG